MTKNRKSLWSFILICICGLALVAVEVVIFYKNHISTSDQPESETIESSDEIEIDGTKLSSIGSYEVGKYCDFTVPYGSTVAVLENDSTLNTEVICIYCKKFMMKISLRNIQIENGEKGLSATYNAFKEDLAEEYKDYSIEDVILISKKAKGLKITSPEAENNLYVIMVPIKDKTLVIDYVYNKSDFFEAEIYIDSVICEMTE